MREDKADAHILEKFSESLSEVVFGEQDNLVHIHLAQLSKDNDHEYISRVPSFRFRHEVPSLGVFFGVLRDNL